MQKLSKYQLKQLSPAERADYEDGNMNVDANKTYFDGGYAEITKEDDGTWAIGLYDDNDFEITSDWVEDSRDVAQEAAEDMIEEYLVYNEEDNED